MNGFFCWKCVLRLALLDIKNDISFEVTASKVFDSIRSNLSIFDPFNVSCFMLFDDSGL